MPIDVSRHRADGFDSQWKLFFSAHLDVNPICINPKPSERRRRKARREAEARGEGRGGGARGGPRCARCHTRCDAGRVVHKMEGRVGCSFLLGLIRGKLKSAPTNAETHATNEGYDIVVLDSLDDLVLRVEPSWRKRWRARPTSRVPRTRYLSFSAVRVGTSRP